MKRIGILFTLLALLLFSGCGTFTKMRYSRGFKSNIELRLGKNEGHVKEVKASKADKKQLVGSFIKVSDNSTFIGNKSLPSSNKKRETIKDIEKKGRVKHQIYPRLPHSFLKKNSSHNRTYDDRPYEPTSRWAAILFIAGLVLSYLMVPFSGILSLVGFILAIIGLRKIRQSGNLYRGAGIDIAIIVLFLLAVIITIIAVILLLAIFI